MVQSLGFPGRMIGPFNVGTATLGTAWATIGTAVEVAGAMRARAYISMQIHAGTDAAFRLQARHTNGGSAFNLPAHAVATATAEVLPLVYQLGSDADQFITLDWELGGTVSWARLQGMIAAGSATYVSQCKLITSI